MLVISLTAGGRGVNFARDHTDQLARRADRRCARCRKSGQFRCARKGQRRSFGGAKREIVLEKGFDYHDAMH